MTGRIVSWWVAFVCAHAWQTVILSLLLTAVLFNYTTHHIGINTDASKMISEKLPWRQTYISYKEKFPQFFGEIAIVIEGATPELADGAARVLAERLRGETTLFKSVYLPGGSEFFRRSGLLYLNAHELADFSDHLAVVQPFLGRLMADQSLDGFFSMLTSAMEAVEEGEDFALKPIMDGITGAAAASLEGSFYRLSWQELMLGEKSTLAGKRRFIVVQPRLDFAELFQGEAALVKIRALADELGLDRAHGVRVRLTGSVALANEEFKSVSKGAGIASILALLAVCVILFVALRSLTLLISSVLTLIAGIIATAAFAAVAVGSLNMISMAFAVLYIGLGIDYAIHLCLRYRELALRGHSHEEAMKKAAGDVGASLVICTITTAAGFYSFIPTAYSGVSELGLISGTGIFISLVVSLTFLPALISLRPIRPSQRAVAALTSPFAGAADRVMARLRKNRAPVFVVLAVMGGIGLVLLGWVSFDSNPMNLRDSSMESVATFNDLMREAGSSPLTIMVVKDKDSAASSALALKRLDLVDKAVSIEDFIPKDQDEKLDIIEEVSLLMGPDLEMDGTADGKKTPESRMETIRALLRGLRAFVATPLDPDEKAAAESALRAMSSLKTKLAAMRPAARAEALGEFEKSLLASLPERLKTLRTSLEAEPVSFADLPPELVSHWVGSGGERVIKVFPKKNISDPRNLTDFVEEVRTVEPQATGLPVVIMESGKTVVRAFRQAFTYALVFIIIILLFLLRDVKYTALVLAPLIYAGILTGAATVLLHIPFNFANIIALPLFLGIGVDNGIHVVHRVRSAPDEIEGLLGSSTSRAVLYSALTTLVSFGGLAFSSHRGMASMGQLLMVGIALTVVSTLGVLPLLFSRGKGKES